MKFKGRMAPLVAAGVLASGAGSGEAAVAVSQIDAIEQTASDNPMQRSLNSFRNGVILKHQAQILMESCVAWPNASNGLTVTWNPGIGEGKINYKGKPLEFRYYAFSTHDSHFTPSWGPLNGPFIEPLNMNPTEPITLVFKPKHTVKGGLVRQLSSREVRGASGETHYRDLQTGEPVMDTVLTTGDFTQRHVAAICEDLRDSKPIPGVA